MSDIGTIMRADLGEEIPRRVLVLSGRRFTSITGRALVAPEWSLPDGVQLFPWEVRVAAGTFLVDRMLSVPADPLLEDVGAAPYQAVAAARRALLAITS